MAYTPPITFANFIEVFPEFASADQTTVVRFITLASDILNETEIGPSKIGIMIIALAAHFFFQEGLEGDQPAGPVISDKVGEITTAYGFPREGYRTDPDMETTKYGRLFLFYRRLVFPSRVS